MEVEVGRVQTLANQDLKELPSQFILPEHERPEFNKAAVEGAVEVPVISLSQPQEKVVKEVSKAAREWGFFAITEHGISDTLMQRVRKEVGEEFFRLPQEVKETYANEPSRGQFQGYGTMLPDGKFGWSDYFYLFLAPPSKVLLHLWPKIPSYREVTEEYKKETVRIYNEILGLLSKGLGLNEEEALKTCLGSDDEMELRMKINFYPPCPQPQQCLGIQPHSDVGTLAFILQNDVSGLQVFKDGNWVPVSSHPNSLFVVVGDQLQLLSNGEYKSVLHRSTVNTKRTRISSIMFINPSHDRLIGPLPELVDDDNPAKYPTTTYGEYRRHKYECS